jgi:hypothetical protein
MQNLVNIIHRWGAQAFPQPLRQYISGRHIRVGCVQNFGECFKYQNAVPKNKRGDTPGSIEKF